MDSDIVISGSTLLSAFSALIAAIVALFWQIQRKNDEVLNSLRNDYAAKIDALSGKVDALASTIKAQEAALVKDIDTNGDVAKVLADYLQRRERKSIPRKRGNDAE